MCQCVCCVYTYVFLCMYVSVLHTSLVVISRIFFILSRSLFTSRGFSGVSCHKQTASFHIEFDLEI